MKRFIPLTAFALWLCCLTIAHAGSLAPAMFGPPYPAIPGLAVSDTLIPKPRRVPDLHLMDKSRRQSRTGRSFLIPGLLVSAVGASLLYYDGRNQDDQVGGAFATGLVLAGMGSLLVIASGPFFLASALTRNRARKLSVVAGVQPVGDGLGVMGSARMPAIGFRLQRR